MSDPFLSQTLRRSLAEWTDVDVASYYVAVALGVAPDPDPGNEWDSWGGKKGMFWSANPLGDGLYRVLEMLAESGVLDKDEEQMKFRWNPKYDWEKHGAPETGA
jgi:hypothetical protein